MPIMRNVHLISVQSLTYLQKIAFLSRADFERYNVFKIQPHAAKLC